MIGQLSCDGSAPKNATLPSRPFRLSFVDFTPIFQHNPLPPFDLGTVLVHYKSTPFFSMFINGYNNELYLIVSMCN